MAWRKPERRDLVAKLTQLEVDQFSASPDFASGADPIADILELTAESVRGFCRSNKQVKMSPVAGTIPEGLMTFAMDYAVCDVLKRLHAEPSEIRKAAWEKALEMFQGVAKGEFIPESYDATATDDGGANRAMPAFSEKTNRRKLLNEYPMI